MQELRLKLKSRDVFGKKTKAILDDGGVLGNVFGKGQDSQAVQGEYQTVSKLIDKAGKTQPIELEIEGGKDELALVSKVERNPITGKIHHIEFHVIHRGEKVHTEVPIKLVGDAPAERTGKIVVTLLDVVEIEAMPSKLPENFEVDVSTLEEENDSINVGNISAPDGVEILTDTEQLIAKVDVPRAEIEEEETEEGEEGDAADVPSEHGGDDAEATEGSEGEDKQE